MAGGLRERGERRLDDAPEQPVREPRRGVLLLDRGRDPQEPGGEHDRSARVPAHPDDHVGPPAPQDPERLPEREREQEQVAEGVDERLPLEPAHLDELDREAGLRDHRGLEPARRADEHDVVARVARHDLLRERDPREDVPSGPAAGDEHPHGAPSALRSPRRSATPLPAAPEGTRTADTGLRRYPPRSAETDSRTPDAARSVMSELPP